MNVLVTIIHCSKTKKTKNNKTDKTHLKCVILKYHMKQMKEGGRIHLLSVVNSTAKQAMQQNKPLVSTQ